MIININEVIEQLGDRTILGYELTQEINFEKNDDRARSLLPVAAFILPKVVKETIQFIQISAGGELHKIEPDSLETISSLSLNKAILALKNKILSNEEPQREWPEGIEIDENEGVTTA